MNGLILIINPILGTEIMILTVEITALPIIFDMLSTIISQVAFRSKPTFSIVILPTPQ